MALVLADRVQQTGTANTTVSFTLTGSVAGFQSFTVIGTGNTTFYSATDPSGNWEVGLGTYSIVGPTLTRTTVYASSNSGSAVTFSGLVTVFVTYPSQRSVNLDSSGNVSALGLVSSGTWQGATVGVAYGGTGVTASSGANSVVLRDANENITVNRINQGLQTITASGGTTVLDAASDFNQALVGTGGQTFRLPDATTLSETTTFQFNNNASGTLTIENNAGTTVGTVAPGGAAGMALLSTATSGGTWDVHAYIPENVTWGTNALALGSTVITGGLWNGGTISSAYGGTGLTTFTGANNALYSTSSSALAAGTLPVAAGGTGNTTGAAAAITGGSFGDLPYQLGPSTTGFIGFSGSTPGQVLTAGVGAPYWGTVTQPVVTPLTTNGIAYATSTSALTTGSALTFDGSNLGLGVTPSAWSSSGNFNLGNSAGIVSTGTYLNFGTNYYYDGAFKYVGTGGASLYTSGPGTHVWYIAASGTAGNTISFVPSMTMDTNGNLGIGTTSPLSRLHVSDMLPSNGTIYLGGATANGYIAHDVIVGAMKYYVSTASGAGHNWYRGGTQQMTLDASGNLGVGTSSPSSKLQVTTASDTQVKVTAGSTNLAWQTFSNGTQTTTVGQENSTGGSLASGTSAYASVFGTNSAYPLQLVTGNIVRATIDASGNLGLGVTPSAWSTGKAFEVAAAGNALWGVGAGQLELSQGAYFNGSWKYGNSFYKPTVYEQIDGEHRWLNAVSGTAGNTITFTQAMTLDAAGDLGIGVTNPGVKLDVAGTIRGTSTSITGAAGGTISPTADTTNQYTITALGAAATISFPTGTPIDGQKLTIRIKDNGTARALTWQTAANGYRAIGVTLPTTTVASKVTYVGCVYNSQDSFWDVVAVTTQA